MSDSPYKTMFETPTDGVFQQELVTYRVNDGMMTKVTVTRKFFKNDYYDSESVEPLCPVK
jgi:hypothetical protein